jgi:FMN phosphatase YigB (HAD superfamily)
MKVILFDLGETLEHNDTLLPGAVKTLTAISQFRDDNQRPLGMGLVSDFQMPGNPADIPSIRQEYMMILERLQIRAFFEPVGYRVTLSTEVGVLKPDRRVFRAALDKFDTALPFEAAMFVTENKDHVAAARNLGMRAVRFSSDPQSPGDITKLTDLIPLVSEFIGMSHA